MRQALVVAFSTCSSSATMPVTLECLEEKAGVSRRVAGFVVPLGATVNMDGTALYEAVAAVFIAQVYGVELGLGSQILIAMMATLAAIGAAWIPGRGPSSPGGIGCSGSSDRAGWAWSTQPSTSPSTGRSRSSSCAVTWRTTPSS